MHLGCFVDQVMRPSGGKANPGAVNDILKRTPQSGGGGLVWRCQGIPRRSRAIEQPEVSTGSESRQLNTGLVCAGVRVSWTKISWPRAMDCVASTISMTAMVSPPADAPVALRIVAFVAGG
jgi:hypothetical protein